MKVLIDANILLDVLQAREPFLYDSQKIWKLCEVDRVEGLISSLTIANLIYIMRKELDPECTAMVLETLSLIFTIADLTGNDIYKAGNLQWNDFEDAVQSVTADRYKVDYIITRNIKDFNLSTVKAIAPKTFLDSWVRR